MHLRLLLSLAVPLLLLALPIAARGKELEGVYTPTQNPCPSPDEAIKKMKVPDGYEVRNFAAEPMVVNPVAMTWDHRGRLWVVELFEYPRGASKPNDYSKTATDEKFRPVLKGGGPDWPRDKVIILEDTDNDGKADKRTVFVDGLNLATGILCGYGGVFVGQAPNLFFFRDNDGNDTADEYKTVLTGFGLEDRHELLNSFTWGPDGWLYMTHGVFTHSKVRVPGDPNEKGNVLNAGVYRVSFVVRREGKVPKIAEGSVSLATEPMVVFHEVFADGTSNPWGVDFDARGNAFVSACVIDHLFHIAPGGLYQRQGGAPENPYAYELLPSIVSHKHFRAAYAGVQIYQGGIYPPDTHGHVFIGNIHDNAIHEESLTPVGATFKAAPVRDFLRANDGWFRPVSTQTGPDGFLWVMDWCDKYPCYQNAQANPEGVDRERGRIWRVCYTGSDEGKNLAGMSRPDKNLELGQLPIVMKRLSAVNNWMRRCASRILTQQVLGDVHLDSNVADELVTIVLQGDVLDERICAFNTLENLHTERSVDIARGFTSRQGWLSDTFIKKLSRDSSSAIRERVLGECRMTAERSAEAPQQPFQRVIDGDILLSLAKDEDAGVRRNTADIVRRVTSGSVTLSAKPQMIDIRPVMETLLLKSSKDEDRLLAFSIWMTLEPYIAHTPGAMLPWLAGLAPKAKPLSQVLTYKTARRITDTRSGENMDLLLGFLDRIKSDDVLTAHALDGILKSQEAGVVKPAKADAAPLFAHWRASKDGNVRNHAGRLATLWGDKAAVAELIRAAEDPKTDPEGRAEAIKTLRKLDSDEARAALLRILEQSLPK